jgi:hypothetical protein
MVLGLSAVVGCAAAVQARSDRDDRQARFGGITGQRQTIDIDFDDSRPRSLKTRLWAECPGQREQRTDWTPADGAPVRFRVDGDRMRIRETKSFDYSNGVHGIASVTLEGRMEWPGAEGTMRALWRFSRGGREYMVCDSGNVPFATGPDARARLARVAPIREPWTLYPARPERRIQLPFGRLRFAGRVDQVCIQTYGAQREEMRRVALRGGRRLRVRGAYVRTHADQLRALMRVTAPPEIEDSYLRWLETFGKRVALERRQLGLLRRGELAAAASIEARIAARKARGNAIGLAFGLGPCVSTGPNGAPKG